MFPPSVPKRLIRGHEVSVYSNRQSIGTWARHEREQVEIALFFSSTVCHLGWSGPRNTWCEREVRGPFVCVIAPGLSHECRLESETDLLVLYVDAALLRRVVPKKITGIMVADAAQHDVLIWLLATLLRHLCVGRVRPDARTIDALGGELACWLVGLLQETKNSVAPAGLCLTSTQREKVMRYMQTNLKHDIHVIDLAKQTGHSVSHFTELFVNTMGHPPFHYLKEIRILKGYEMLATGDYLAREVALAVGYSNADHFCELFRKAFGVSPRALLRRVRSGAASCQSLPEERRDVPAVTSV